MTIWRICDGTGIRHVVECNSCLEPMSIHSSDTPNQWGEGLGAGSHACPECIEKMRQRASKGESLE